MSLERITWGCGALSLSTASEYCLGEFGVSLSMGTRFFTSDLGRYLEVMTAMTGFGTQTVTMTGLVASTETEDKASAQERRLAALRRANEARKAGGPVKRLDPMEKARQNPNSLRAAVTAKCWDCEGADADPHPRWRVANCRISGCPLWPVRPWQKLHGKPTPPGLRSSDED